MPEAKRGFSSLPPKIMSGAAILWLLFSERRCFVDEIVDKAVYAFAMDILKGFRNFPKADPEACVSLMQEQLMTLSIAAQTAISEAQAKFIQAVILLLQRKATDPPSEGEFGELGMTLCEFVDIVNSRNFKKAVDAYWEQSLNVSSRVQKVVSKLDERVSDFFEVPSKGEWSPVVALTLIAARTAMEASEYMSQAEHTNENALDCGTKFFDLKNPDEIAVTPFGETFATMLYVLASVQIRVQLIAHPDQAKAAELTGIKTLLVQGIALAALFEPGI